MSISELTLRYFHQSNKSNAVLAGNYFFLLKQIFALFVVVAVFALIIGFAWFALTFSPYLALGGIAIIAAGVLLPYWLALPMLHPRRTQPQFTPADFDLPNWDEVHFFSTDGVELRGWFIPPDPKSNGATLVFVHGLGGNRGQLLSQAALVIARGYGALLFDLRNHGNSCGNLTTLGYTEADDVRGAVNYLLSRPEVNPDRIGLVGYSMGGAAVLRAATRLPHVKAIVSESAYTSIADNITQGMIAKTGLPPFPFAPLMIWFGERLTGLRVHQVRPIDDVARLKHPVLFVHGAEDKTINVNNSRALYAAANEPKGLYVVRNASHVGLLGADPVGFERYVLGFLDQNLR